MAFRQDKDSKLRYALLLDLWTLWFQKLLPGALFSNNFKYAVAPCRWFDAFPDANDAQRAGLRLLG